MTKRGEATRNQLLRDIEAYTCGEVPNDLDLMRATRLDHWYVYIRRRGKEYAMTLRGEVSRHPEMAASTSISTSELAWFDRKARFARTKNRLYALGDPVGGAKPIEGDDE
jgi:hypothetical protein